MAVRMIETGTNGSAAVKPGERALGRSLDVTIEDQERTLPPSRKAPAQGLSEGESASQLRDVLTPEESRMLATLFPADGAGTDTSMKETEVYSPSGSAKTGMKRLGTYVDFVA